MNRSIFVLLLALSLMTVSGVKAEEVENIPLCRTMSDIVAHDGQVVTLEGVFKTSDAGKTWITSLVLSDGTRVVYRYNRLSDLDGKKARVTGTVYKRGYPVDEMVQMLLAPHIRDVTKVDMLP